MKITYEEVGEKIRALIEMNRTIEHLRFAEKIAYAAMAASVITLNAAGARIAKKVIDGIRTTRKILRARQQWLIQSANLKLFRTRSQVFHRLRGASRTLGLVEREIVPGFSLPVRVAIRKADQDRELPKYELMPDFERRQKMELKWQSRYRKADGKGRSRDPRGANEEDGWKIAKATWPESCGMTLENLGTAEKPRFQARPTQDKYFWKR